MTIKGGVNEPGVSTDEVGNLLSTIGEASLCSQAHSECDQHGALTALDWRDGLIVR